MLRAAKNIFLLGHVNMGASADKALQPAPAREANFTRPRLANCDTVTNESPR